MNNLLSNFWVVKAIFKTLEERCLKHGGSFSRIPGNASGANLSKIGWGEPKNTEDLIDIILQYTGHISYAFEVSGNVEIWRKSISDVSGLIYVPYSEVINVARYHPSSLEWKQHYRQKEEWLAGLKEMKQFFDSPKSEGLNNFAIKFNLEVECGGTADISISFCLVGKDESNSDSMVKLNFTGALKDSDSFVTKAISLFMNHFSISTCD